MAAFRRAFARFAPSPLVLRASCRCALARRARSRRSWRGLAIFSPVERVRRWSSPTSMPTAALAAESGLTDGSSHSRDTCQRPAASWDTVTVDGDTPSGRGRDHTMSSGSAIFARVSFPSRNRNALVVYSADFRDFFRDLKRGYFARLPKKFENAVWRCRSACWSGTEETSARYASSSVFFQAVSIADVAL